MVNILSIIHPKVNKILKSVEYSLKGDISTEIGNHS